MAEKRYVGDYPVIGIRPIIDGRRGPMKLRESLEDQTMALALAAKKLFEDLVTQDKSKARELAEKAVQN